MASRLSETMTRALGRLALPVLLDFVVLAIAGNEYSFRARGARGKFAESRNYRTFFMIAHSARWSETSSASAVANRSVANPRV